VNELTLRPLSEHAGDDDAVRRIFRQTVVLGGATPFPLPDLDRYEQLCLGWYLTEGRPWAAVLVRPPAATGPAAPRTLHLVEAEEVVGYVLVCPATSVHQRWVRGRALRFTARTVGGLLTRRYEREARTFWWLRLRDGWRSWRHGLPAPMPMHVHLNLDPDVRATSAGRLLAGHADAVCRAEGLVGWFGEVNARAGHRARALERLGGVVVHRTPNLTFSWVRGEPVERLTVVRTLTWPDPRPERVQARSADRSRATVASSTPIPAT
jgi:hypothetical protein